MTRWDCDCRAIALGPFERLYGLRDSQKFSRKHEMNIDFDKSHPAMNMDDKRGLYVGFLRVSVICTAAVSALMIGMFIFLT